jgi:hypothetical protein
MHNVGAAQPATTKDTDVKAITNFKLEAKHGFIMLLLQFSDELICHREYNLNVINAVINRPWIQVLLVAGFRIAR